MNRLETILLTDKVSFVIRVLLGCIWIYAGVTKMGHHIIVQDSILNYEIFTPVWAGILAYLIGPLELIGGIFLVLGIFTRTALKISIGVLVLFIIGISQAWMRGLSIDCGCFGSDHIGDAAAARGYVVTIVRDIIMICASIYVIYHPVKQLSVDRWRTSS